MGLFFSFWVFGSLFQPIQGLNLADKGARQLDTEIRESREGMKMWRLHDCFLQRAGGQNVNQNQLGTQQSFHFGFRKGVRPSTIFDR